MAAAADARAEAAAIAAENGQIRERKEAVERDKADAEAKLEESRKEAKANRRALEDARDEATAVANIIAGHSLRMEERKKKAAAANEERVKLTMDVGALDNRIRLLFGEEYGLHVYSMPELGTTVEITLPIITSDRDVRNREVLR